ncbi:MAG TPA: TonB-dependent receptor [Caulobacteraceae bacterium]|jgi:hypothetical protein
MSSVAVLAALLASAQGATTPPSSPPAEPPPPVNAGQVSGPDTDAPVTPPSETGTLVFQPSFFAEARPNTASDMVARIPGFAISQNTSVRGFSGAAGNVLVDGARPASKNEGLGDILARIPATEVVRIELIRGGAPGVDMQGFSQVVNVIRKKTASRQQVVSVGFAGYSLDHRLTPTLRYELNGRAGERTYEFATGTSTANSDSSGSARLIRLQPDGAVSRDVNQRVEADGDGLNARARLQQPLAGGVVEVAANVSHFDFKLEQNTAGFGFNQIYVDNFDDYTGEGSIRYERPFGSRWRGELRGIQKLNQREGYQDALTDGSDQVFTYSNLSGESIVRGSLKLTQSPTLSWEGGLEAAYNFLDADQSFTLEGERIPLPSDQVLVEELRGEAFLTAAWRVRENLSVDAGIRLEASRISQSGTFNLSREFFYPKPRVLVTWSITPSDQIRVRLEHQVSQLNFGDFAASAQLQDEQVSAGATDLRPDQTTTIEAAYERRFWGDGVLTMTGSYGLITDAIDIVPVFLDDGGILPAVGNVGDGHYQAFVIDTTIPTDRLGVGGGRLRLRGSWVETTITDPLTGEERRPSGQSPFIPLIGFTQDLQKLRTNWGVDYRWANYSENFRITDTSRTDVTNVITAFADYKPQPSLSLRGQVNYIGAIDNDRIFYTGARHQNPVAYIEQRRLDPEIRYSFRVRKTF